MSSEFGELWPTSSWDLLASLGHPCKFQPVSHLCRLTAQHCSSGRQPNFAALNRGRHLYSAGRPSRWTLSLSFWYFCVSGYFWVIVILCCQYQCSRLPGKTVPGMTYYVLRGTLSCSSLTHARTYWCFREWLSTCLTCVSTRNMSLNKLCVELVSCVSDSSIWAPVF